MELLAHHGVGLEAHNNERLSVLVLLKATPFVFFIACNQTLPRLHLLQYFMNVVLLVANTFIYCADLLRDSGSDLASTCVALVSITAPI